MNENKADRRTYEGTCELLQELGYLEKGSVPPLPERQPRHDDEEPLGVCFFRTFVGDGDLENLTLPRTYVAKSEVGPVSFRNTDLSESTLCWNDFNNVDFTDSDLSRCDLRASIFQKAVFVRSNLRNADLRRSIFDTCDFTEADTQGTRLTQKQGKYISLSSVQRQGIDWQDSDGDEPPGG
jgi:BTB/POZ domain-containing protein KCTD9